MPNDTFDGKTRHELAARLPVGIRSAGLALRVHAALFDGRVSSVEPKQSTCYEK